LTGGGAAFTYGNSRELLSIQRSNGVTTKYRYDVEDGWRAFPRARRSHRCADAKRGP